MTAPYPFLLPATIYFLVFWIGPFLFTIGISMTDLIILGLLNKVNFSGPSNFINLFANDPIFLTAVRNTFFYAVVNTPLVLVLGMGLALG